MKVLVFGGTQFLGRLTVGALLDAGHEVILINRCRTASPFKARPTLRCVKADRMGDREGFKAAVAEQGSVDVVLDFIGFQEAYMQDALEALTLASREADGRRRFATKHYIFISTDSVYWAQKVPCVADRLTESDAQDFSPEEFEVHNEYCMKTSLGEYQLRYGGNKLACERVLEEAWRTDSFPYTVLRLPDVYGPWDNLGGFWELVQAIEARRPIPSGLRQGRIRTESGDFAGDPKTRRFSWAFAEDVSGAILACLSKGAEVQGMTIHVGHEEAVHLRETAAMIADSMGLGSEACRFDDRRDSALPSTDFGPLDLGRALRLLKPWRPTPMRAAVKRSVDWFLSSRENRRYHRLVHREPRFYDDSEARNFNSDRRDVPECWVGGPEKAALVRDGPVMLNDSLPDFTGQAVLAFMQRLMDQAGELQVACELQRASEVERQTWPLRHFAGHLLTQSEHSAAYRLETAEVLSQTDLLGELTSPVGELRQDESGNPPARLLCLGGSGSRSVLRRTPAAAGPGGFWDCTLLGRRKWRLFPPETPAATLCASADESPVDCFCCGPDVTMVAMRFTGFAPAVFWECEQTMGDAVIVPNGWWYQTYDDDRTLSISAKYGGLVPSLLEAKPGTTGGYSCADDPDDPEVMEWDVVD